MTALTAIIEELKLLSPKKREEAAIFIHGLRIARGAILICGKNECSKLSAQKRMTKSQLHWLLLSPYSWSQW